MKITKTLSLPIIIFLLIVSFLCIYQSNSANAIESPLLFRAETNKENYNLGEIVKVKYFVKNKSSNTVLISMTPSKEIMKFIYLGGQGNKEKTDIATYDRRALPQEAFIIIRPGHETQMGEAEFDKTYFSTAGNWEIVVSRYHDYSGDDLGLKAWTGTLVSNCLSLQIAKK
jgi:hypothetical protein